MENLDWCGYPIMKNLMTRLAVSTKYQRVTDGQTDGQTFFDSSVCAIAV